MDHAGTKRAVCSHICVNTCTLSLSEGAAHRQTHTQPHTVNGLAVGTHHGTADSCMHHAFIKLKIGLTHTQTDALGYLWTDQ